jgi:integrase
MAGSLGGRRCEAKGQPFTQKVIQGLIRRVARRANVKPGVHILRHTFCSHLAMRGAPARAIQELAGHQDLGTTQRYMHPEPGGARRGDSIVGDGDRNSPRGRGEIVEAAGTEGPKAHFH